MSRGKPGRLEPEPEAAGPPLLDVGAAERRRCACISKFCLAFGSLACIVGCAVAWSFLSHIDYSI